MACKKLIVLMTIVSLNVMAALGMAAQDMPEPEAAPFWTYMTKTNPYTEWKPWPGKEDMLPGTSPHGAFLKLFVNDVALKAIEEDKPMPDGAIIVKENYGKDKEKLMAITPMYLKKGYNPDAGDWFWAKYGPEGEVMASGKVEGCIGCHRTRDNWLFTEKK